MKAKSPGLSHQDQYFSPTNPSLPTPTKYGNVSITDGYFMRPVQVVLVVYFHDPISGVASSAIR